MSSHSPSSARAASFPPTSELAFVRQLLAIDPGSASLRAQLANALLISGDAPAARAEADTACARDPSLVQAWLARAGACRVLRQFGAAADSLERAEQIAPGQSAILVALGTTYAELGRLADAAATLRRAAAIDPRSTAAAANLGGVYLRLGDTARALDASRAALAIDPTLVSAHQNLATLLAASHPAEARAHRDAAYIKQSLFVEPAARPCLTALVLTAAGPGNVPLDHLLPREHVTLIRWYVEYATADQLGRLPRHDLVFNAIGDADCAPPLAAPVRDWLRGHRVLNDPDRVLATRRSALPALLAGLDQVVVPDSVLLGQDDPEAIDALPKPPALVRPVGAHGGDGVLRADTEDAVSRAVAASRPCYVTSFVDSRGDDDMYRKYRAIFVDRVPYPYHLAITENWLVHYWTAGMDTYPSHRAEEAKFLDDPAGAIGAKAWAAIGAIGARLDLDYAGIDFAVLPGEKILVFEANATMLVHPEEDSIFSYKNKAVERILAAFTTLIPSPASAPATA